MRDVLVVGGGLSGLTAALTAARAGAKVTLLTAGGSALLGGTGTIDFADSPGLDLLPGLRAREDGAPWQFPTPLGTWRPTWLAPPSYTAGDRSFAGTTLVVGLAELKDFYPRLMAANLGWRSVLVALGLPQRRDLSPSYVAAYLEREWPTLVAAVAPHVEGVDRVGFPAVLGFYQPVFDKIADALGRPVFEFAIMPPSVPGLRLQQQLHDLLIAEGVQLALNAQVTRLEVEGERVVAAWVGRRRFTAAAFVLATGDLYTGGLVARGGRVYEPLLDLPVEQSEVWATPQLGRQPFEEFGVGPLPGADDGAEAPSPRIGGAYVPARYVNLAVAGSLLAGPRSSGRSVASGYEAGLFAVEVAAHV